MGIKFLNLQMIPWCFHLMGNHVSCVQFQADDDVKERPAAVGTIKLVKSDGLVKIYHQPIHVSELMLEFPKHMVCRSDSFYIGQKVPTLSEDDQLQLGQNYFLLPKHFFQSALTFVTISSFASSQSTLQNEHDQHERDSESDSDSDSSPILCRDSKTAFLKKAARCQPFHILKSPSGCLRIRVSEEFLSQLMEQGKIKEDDDQDQNEIRWSEEKAKSILCTTPQLEKEYMQLVGSRQWKPKLDPIREYSSTKKMSRLSSFGIKRSRKNSNINSEGIGLKN